MANPLDEIVHNARSGAGHCRGCPATTDRRAGDGEPRAEGVNPGLGAYDAAVLFVTIEPSPSHGRAIDWDQYDWSTYNAEFYPRLLVNWDSGEAVRAVIEPIDGLTTSDVWVADSVKCPPPEGADDEARTEAFDCCRHYLRREIAEVDPEVVVTLGNRAGRRTLDVLDGPDVDLGAATQAGRRLGADPPVLVAPSWSHGWLFDRAVHGRWGSGWVDDFPELRDGDWDSYVDVVQVSLESYLGERLD